MEEGDAEGFARAGFRRSGRERGRGREELRFCAESREAACGAYVDFELYG